MPFFYQDATNDTTLFVQPTETQTVSYVMWPGWVGGTVNPAQSYGPITKTIGPIAPVTTPVTLDPGSLFGVLQPVDWTAAPAATVAYGGLPIGPRGAVASVTLQQVVAESASKRVPVLIGPQTKSRRKGA